MKLNFFNDFINQEVVYDEFPSHIRRWTLTVVTDEYVSLTSNNHHMKFLLSDTQELNILRNKLEQKK